MQRVDTSFYNSIKSNNFLKIIALNVNSIVSTYRRNNLDVFIKEHNPDILAISETKLTKKHKLFFENYKIIRNDRKNKGGGGTALFVHKKIECTQISTPPNLEVLELSIVCIRLAKKKLYIISSYAAGSSNIKINNDLNILCKKLKLENPENSFIIIGDLNSKHTNWNNSSINYRGSQLNNWLCENEIKYNCILLNSQIPTLYNCNSYIDIALVKNMPNCNIEVLNEFNSDHLPVLVTVNEIPVDHEPGKTFLNYSKANWSKFRTIIEQEIRLTEKLKINRFHD